MIMGPHEFQAVVEVAYGQLHLITASPATFDIFSPPHRPLVYVGEPHTAMCIMTGCLYGDVGLRIELHDEPPEDNHREWEVQQELSIHFDQPLFLDSPTTEGRHDAVLAPASPGPHRVRVSAVGRWVNHGGAQADSGGPRDEHYLAQFWPETALRPEIVLKDDGAYPAETGAP